MVPDAFRYIPFFAIGVTTTVFIFRLVREGQMDGGCRTLGRCFDKGAEQDVGKWVEPGLHRNHVRADNPRIRCVDGDILVADSSGKFLSEQEQRQFGIAIDRDTEKTSVLSFFKEIRVDPADRIRAGHRVYNAASRLHQGQ